jgi:hypothetical protein
MLVLSCGQRLLCSALTYVQRSDESSVVPVGYVSDHRAKDLSAELQAALCRVQLDVADTDASHAWSLSRRLSFDHGCSSCVYITSDLLVEPIGSSGALILGRTDRHLAAAPANGDGRVRTWNVGGNRCHPRVL